MIRSDQTISGEETDTFNKFEKFFDVTPDLLCVAGFDGYFKRINPAVSELLGYSTEELLSRPIDDFVYHEDKKTTSNARNDLRSKIPLFNFENRYLTKKGAIVWLLWTSLPIEDEKHVYAIAKNITYKKELEEERNLNLAELTKINSDYKQLTYTSAHDLRSPVNNLLSVFELLDTSSIKDPETLEFIEILKSTSESLKQTLNEHVALLNKRNDDNAHLEKVNLNDVLNEVLLSINALVQNSQAQIRINFEALKTIHFNKAYLKSIFLNLITNAIKYSKSDLLPVISIYTEIKDGRKQLIVSDNGIGFDMEEVKGKIFGLHQKFHNHVDSNGIGLYLVYNHITNLGGNITVKSKVNQGAKFIVTFKD
jgi:PAS domain S-box-containing protein